MRSIFQQNNLPYLELTNDEALDPPWEKKHNIAFIFAWWCASINIFSLAFVIQIQGIIMIIKDVLPYT